MNNNRSLEVCWAKTNTSYNLLRSFCTKDTNVNKDARARSPARSCAPLRAPRAQRPPSSCRRAECSQVSNGSPGRVGVSNCGPNITCGSVVARVEFGRQARELKPSARKLCAVRAERVRCAEHRWRHWRAVKTTSACALSQVQFCGDFGRRARGH